MVPLVTVASVYGGSVFYDYVDRHFGKLPTLRFFLKPAPAMAHEPDQVGETEPATKGVRDLLSWAPTLSTDNERARLFAGLIRFDAQWVRSSSSDQKPAKNEANSERSHNSADHHREGRLWLVLGHPGKWP